MKEILVVGAGPAAITFLNKLIEKGTQHKITLVNKLAHSFNKKELISSLRCKKELELESWAQSCGIEFICDSIERINTRRRKIYFKQGSARDFETLVVATGAKSKKIEVKGEHREGFFYLSDMEPAKLKDFLRISKDAVIAASTILGIKLALALSAIGKEARIISPDLDFLGFLKEKCLNFLEEKNIACHLNSSIEEAIGEGAVKATKVKPLKVFSSDLVFIDSGFSPNLGFFEDELKVHDTFFSAAQDVYLLGDATRPDLEQELFFPFNYQEAVAQGGILADFILDKKEPVFERREIQELDKQRVIEELLKTKETAESL